MNNYFEKKITCLQFKKQIEEKLQKETTETGAVVGIDKIFYSPKRDSCLYGATCVYMNNKGVMVSRTHQIVDILTEEEIYSACASILDGADSFIKVWNTYQEKLKTFSDK